MSRSPYNWTPEERARHHRELQKRQAAAQEAKRIAVEAAMEENRERDRKKGIAQLAKEQAEMEQAVVVAQQIGRDDIGGRAAPLRSLRERQMIAHHDWEEWSKREENRHQSERVKNRHNEFEVLQGAMRERAQEIERARQNQESTERLRAEEKRLAERVTRQDEFKKMEPLEALRVKRISQGLPPQGQGKKLGVEPL